MRRAIPLVLAGLLLMAVPGSAIANPTPSLGHDGRWITDARGRVVIMHGLNMVYKRPPYSPAAIGFGPDDASFLERHGFNTVRLGLIYAGVEPRGPLANRHRYDDHYIRKVRGTERMLGRHGIFSLLDFHQDLYNERFQGEGWPDWAVIDDGLPAEPREGFPQNYLTMPALNRAFDHFWANDTAHGIGLTDAYARAWQHVAALFRSDRYVAGYDLLNEPWPGSVYPTCSQPAGCPVFDATTLTDFSTEVIEHIRRTDPRTLAFYEPLLNFDFGAQTSHGDTGDRHAGMSFHDYCLPGAFGGPTGSGCRSAEELPFQNAENQSEKTGDALFLTEFGATRQLASIKRLVKLADRHMVSWQEWHYCGCREPTSQVSPRAQALVVDPRKPPRGRNVERRKLRVLDRPYPQAIAGTPESYSYRPRTDRFELTYSTAGTSGDPLRRRIQTRVYIPRLHYHRHYSVDVNGAVVVSRKGARYLRLRRVRGANEVSVVVRPTQ